jgi:hypothetical protein
VFLQACKHTKLGEHVERLWCARCFAEFACCQRLLIDPDAVKEGFVVVVLEGLPFRLVRVREDDALWLRR